MSLILILVSISFSMEPILIAKKNGFHINEKKEAMEQINPDHPQNYPVYPEFLKRVPKFTTSIYSLLVLSREWMGCWVAVVIITSDEMDHSRKFPA